MTNNSMTKEEWYAQQSKEQLIIFLKNNDYFIEELEHKLVLLTGCPFFGSCDGTNGACIDCSLENTVLFNRCLYFQSAFHEFRKDIKVEENKHVGT